MDNKAFLLDFLTFSEATMTLTIDMAKSVVGTYTISIYGYYISGQNSYSSFTLVVGAGC